MRPVVEAFGRGYLFNLRAMNIQCFYKGQRAYYQGIDRKKGHHKVKTEDGQMHYPLFLEQIQFIDHAEQKTLFQNKTAS